MFKFIHAADLHLDSPLRGLDAYPGAPARQIREAARAACTRLVDLAIDEHVGLVVIAGDVYDGDWRDYKTGLFFVAQMARLRQAGIEICLIAGNHDAANKMTRSLKLPEGVRFFSPQQAETVVYADLGAAVHGRSFAQPAETGDLSQSYPAAVRAMFNIGLLHTSADGRPGHARYAPCTIDGLLARGYDYWALGHVHDRGEPLHEAPYIGFSGNIQGRHSAETGPKGCLLVTVDDAHRAAVEFRPLATMRWERRDVDLAGASSRDDALQRAAPIIQQAYHDAERQTLALRLTLVAAPDTAPAVVGDGRDLAEQLRSLALDHAGGDVWIEKVAYATRHNEARRHATTHAGGALDELAAMLDDLRREPRRAAALLADVAKLAGMLPPELTGDEGPVRPDDETWLRSLLDEVEPLLVGRLTTPGAAP